METIPRHRDTLQISDHAVLVSLTGPQSALLAEVAKRSNTEISLRGDTIHLAGDQEDVVVARRFLAGAATLVGRGYAVVPEDVARALRELARDPSMSLNELLEETILVSPKRRPIVPKTANQRSYVRMIRSHDLTFGIGPAGTGKTYLAMAVAASALVQKQVKRIVLTRPAVEAGEKLGFLPGDLAEKVNPYLRPLYDALGDMLELEKVEQMKERQQIEVAPLAFMRGRTLNESFVILDEAQNATPEQMRMFLTRLGYGSRAVVTGDITQTDLPSGTRSGLREAKELFEGIEGIGFLHFTDVDVVRHPLVQRIIIAYEKRDAEIAKAKEAYRAAREAERTARDDRDRRDYEGRREYDGRRDDEGAR